MTDVSQQAPPIPPPTPEVDVGELIGKAVALRDLIAQKDDEHKLAMQPYTEAFNQLENYLLGVLQDAKLDNMKKKGAGTISILDKFSSPIDDPAAFQDYVITNQQWSLANISANTTAVRDFLKTNNTLPPGVRLTTFRKLGLRRPSKTDAE